MSGAAASCDSVHDPHLRAASWLQVPDDRVDVADGEPPIWRWPVPLEAGGIEITAYLGSFDNTREPQDALLVLEHPRRIVLAVADGVTPTERTPEVGNIDGAQFAARTVLEHVRGAPRSWPLGDVFRTANDALLRRFGPVSGRVLHERDRPQTAALAVALGLPAGGGVDVLDAARAADCEVWERHGGTWSQRSEVPLLKRGARVRLQRWDTQYPDASHQLRIVEENRFLWDRSQWNLTALGRFERPKVDAPDIDPGFDELVLVTDGADVGRYGAAPPFDPCDWLAQLRAFERRGRPPGRRHSDVAMLHLRRQASMR